MEDVEAYWQYHKMVGDEAGDDVMTPEQYEEYKSTVVQERIKNRSNSLTQLYTVTLKIYNSAIICLT